MVKKFFLRAELFIIYLINFLLAVSTTIGMTVIPFLITESLGFSLQVLGLLEGSTEFLSNIFRLVNGVLFDKVKNKRMIFVCSTGIAFLAKTLLLVPSILTILLSKTLERVSNGAFASPRDALVAEKSRNKGLALSLLTVSKTAGCVCGPLIVSISTFFLGDLKSSLHIFVVLCCLLVFPTIGLSFYLNVSNLKESRFSLGELRVVFKKISPVLLLSFLFFMGRFNDGLLMMYLKQKGYPEWFYLSTIGIFNFVMVVTSPIIGWQIDTGHIKKIVYVVIGALALFNICFFQIDLMTWGFAIIGLIAWGIQRTGAQIAFSFLVFKNIEKIHYGTAIGIFYLVSGFATMLSSFMCGYFAKNYFSYVFILSGSFSFLALIFTMSLLDGKRWFLRAQQA